MRIFSDEWEGTVCSITCQGVMPLDAQVKIAKFQKLRGNQFRKEFLPRLRAVEMALKSYGLDKSPVGDSYANPLDSVVNTLAGGVNLNDYLMKAVPDRLEEFVTQTPQAECGVCQAVAVSSLYYGAWFSGTPA